jgi:iron complex outermembrane receptor protein
LKITDGQSLSFGGQYYNDEQDSDYGRDYGPGLAVLFGAQPGKKPLRITAR